MPNTVISLGSETITIQSAPIMGAAAKTGELGFHDAYCRYQDAISLEVPNRVKVGEVFNVTVAFSFAEDSELDADYWNDNCYGFVQVRYPPNYQATGEGLVQSHTYVHEGYDPPIVSHGMIYPEIAYGQQPLTFQMRINESRDGVYDVGARVASTRSSDYNITSYVAKDYSVYDFGSFTVARGHNVVSASAYTLISDGIVHLSDVDSQTRSDENKPRPVDPDYHTELNIVTHNQTGEGDIPFDFFAEALENEPFVDWSPLSLIRAFGYNSTYANNYVEEFLRMYPKFETPG